VFAWMYSADAARMIVRIARTIIVPDGAYEPSPLSISGNAFECFALLIIVRSFPLLTAARTRKLASLPRNTGTCQYLAPSDAVRNPA